jgi:A/G-specific adenine glycosylase
MLMSVPDSPTSLPSPELARSMRRRLLAWFNQSQRDLPWRRDRDPYRIWVSEVMLQQTTVAAVVPYFERFLQAFPTVTALAAADEAQVLRLWEGLGYYRRARNLHRAARVLVEKHAGQLPNDPAAWHGLPGVGRYTVGAVLSQAFDRRLPILEANSRRVLCRLFARTGDPTRAPLQTWLWSAAEALLPKRKAGHFNQALMELGALVCTPVNPACRDCPLRPLCQAHRQGLQEQIPERPPEPTITAVHEAAVVLRRGDTVLLVQRPEHGRWAGLWEFPHGSINDGESPKKAAERLARDLTGITATVGGELLTIRHGITRYRITLVCFTATPRRGTFRSQFYRLGVWAEVGRLGEYPFSAPQRRLAAAVTKRSVQGWLF